MRKRAFEFASGVVALVMTSSVLAEPPACPREVVAVVDSVEGEASVDGVAVRVGSALHPGDMLVVGARSRAAVRMLAATVALRLDQNTELRLQCPEAGHGPHVLQLLRGAIKAILRFPEKLIIDAPFANAAVEGTEFLVSSDASHTDLEVYDGAVRFTNAFGEVVARAGEVARAEAGGPPVLRLLVTPGAQAQWTLFVPVAALAEAAPDSAARNALALLERGRLAEASTTVAAHPDTTNDGRAARLAIESFIAIAEDRTADALTTAREAYDLAPSSTLGAIAYSYALQANEHVREALALLEGFAARAPSATVSVRLSELYLAIGDAPRATAAARDALSRVDTGGDAVVLAWARGAQGFTQLARAEPRAALESFRSAVALAPSDPRARFGLGLAQVRLGDYANGRSALEMATLLDPRNALYRNYLGRTYQALANRAAEAAWSGAAGRPLHAMALEQYRLAARADVNDPTTAQNEALYFADQNQPSRAIVAARSAIAQNRARAHYRSQALLNRDLSSRAVSLATQYQRVGFETLAALEAARAVERDPTNDIAHELLSRVAMYQRHTDVVAAGEALVTQLYQPITRRPISLGQREIRLSVPRMTGLSDMSFGEYSAAFDSDGASLTSTTVFGTRGTVGSENILAATRGAVLVNLANLTHRASGVRLSNHNDVDLSSGFVQVRIAPSLMAFGEYRDRSFERGNLDFQFDFDPRFDAYGLAAQQRTRRGGLRWSVTADTDVVAVLGSYDLVESGDPAFGSSITNLWDYQGMVTTRWDRAVVQFGGRRRDESLSLPGGAPDLRQREDLGDAAVFTMANLALTPTLRAVAGVEANHVKRAPKDLWRTLPRLGLEWQPGANASVRAAYFQSRTPSLTGLALVAPSTLVGFPLLNDEETDTDSQTAAVALDLGWGQALRFGGSARYRDLRALLGGVGAGGFGDLYAHQIEHTVGGYFNGFIGERVTIAIEPRFTGAWQYGLRAFMRPDAIRTWVVPLRVRSFFAPGELAGQWAGRQRMFIEMRVDGVRQVIDYLPGGTRNTRRDAFGTLDLGLGLLLPGNRGSAVLAVRNVTNEDLRYAEPFLGNIRQVYPDYQRGISAQFVLTLHWDSSW